PPAAVRSSKSGSGRVSGKACAALSSCERSNSMEETTMPPAIAARAITTIRKMRPEAARGKFNRVMPQLYRRRGDATHPRTRLLAIDGLHQRRHQRPSNLIHHQKLTTPI